MRCSMKEKWRVPSSRRGERERVRICCAVKAKGRQFRAGITEPHDGTGGHFECKSGN